MKKLLSKFISVNEKYDLFLIFACLYLFVCSPISSLAETISFPSLLTKGLLIVSLFVLLLSFPRIIKELIIADLLVVGSLFLLSVFSMIAFKNNYADVISGLRVFFTSLLFYYILFRLCRNSNKRISVISYASIFNSFVLFIVSLLHFKAKRAENMTLCYQTLLFTSICLSSAFFESKSIIRKVVFVIPSLLGVVAIYLFGSRGPLIFFFVLLLTIIYLKIHNQKTKKIYLGAFLSIVVAILLLFVVCVFVYNSGNGNKFVVEVLKTYGKVFFLSGREYLFALELGAYRYSPILGYGLFGDRFLSIGFIFSNPQTTNFSSLVLSPYTTYSHTLFIESLLSLGGPLLILILFFATAFFINYLLPLLRKKDASITLLLPLIITGLFSLMLSNSFVVSNHFWAFLGYCVYLYTKYDERNYSKLINTYNNYCVINV